MSRLDDPLIVDELCKRISAGESIAQICADKRMPSPNQVYGRMALDESFRIVVSRAREAQQEHEVDAMIDIADAATPEDVHVAKLRIWARQWRAAKLAPKKYGDNNKQAEDQTHRVEILISGGPTPRKLETLPGDDTDVV